LQNEFLQIIFKELFFDFNKILKGRNITHEKSNNRVENINVDKAFKNNVLNNIYFKQEKTIDIENNKKEKIKDKTIVNFGNHRDKHTESFQNLDKKCFNVKEKLSECKSLIDKSEYNNQENNKTFSKKNDQSKIKNQTMNSRKNIIINMNENEVNENSKSKKYI